MSLLENKDGSERRKASCVMGGNACSRVLFAGLTLGTTTLIIFVYCYRSHTFRDVEMTQQTFNVPDTKLGVFMFRNVCIESNSDDKYPTVHSIKFKNSLKNFQETRRIVIYDRYYTNGTDTPWGTRQKLSVSGSANSIWNEWDVTFEQPDSFPASRRVHKDKAAFFISQTCPGNLHHFWEDEFRLLHSLVSATNRLDSHVKNQLLYRIPWDLEGDELDCYDVRVYQRFLYMLNFEQFHDVFYKVPDGTCFDHGVFGLSDFSDTKRDASNYVLNRLGITYDSCPQNRVTIIQRTFRRILNMESLVNITKNEGFPDVHVVHMEKLTLEEQIRTAACTTILVGVQGAGLQWAVFMKPGSTLIEIAWPKQFWNYYFDNYVTPYNIYHRGVLANHLRVNWPAYQQKVRGGSIVPADERQLLLVTKPKNLMDNIWKWADPIVEEKHYMYALRSHKYANLVKYHK